MLKNWSKLALKTGPSMLRNKIGPVLTLEMGHFCLFSSCFEKSSSFRRENEIYKNKKKTTQKMDQFLTLKKANIRPVFNSTAHIYIYIYACML